jgi:hypothetical protein
MRGLFLLLFVCATICAGEHKHHPTGASEGVASLDVCVDGVTTHLLLAIATPGKPARVEHRSSSDGGATWSIPVVVDVGAPPHSPARHNDLQIAPNRCSPVGAPAVAASWARVRWSPPSVTMADAHGVAVPIPRTMAAIKVTASSMSAQTAPENCTPCGWMVEAVNKD